MEDEKKLKDGFNKGYIIRKYKPELAITIQRGLIDKESPFCKGFLSGIQEAEIERSVLKHKNRSLKDWKIRPPQKSKDKDLDMDK